MINKFLLIHFGLILLCLAGQGNCFISAQNRKIKFRETFALQPDETAETEDAKLRVRLKGVGRTISEGGEVEYVELLVNWNKSERLIVISERTKGTAVVGNYLIKLIDAESFGKAHCQMQISLKD